jgi:hypothetical protein
LVKQASTVCWIVLTNRTQNEPVPPTCLPNSVLSSIKELTYLRTTLCPIRTWIPIKSWNCRILT